MILMISSGIYLVLRITSIVLVKGFGFIIFLRTYDLNLWNLAPTMDIIMAAICFTVSFVYFNGIKRVIISFMGLLLFLYSVYMWFPMMIFSQSLTSIESPLITDKYAVYQYSYRGYQGERVLYIGVYKEHYPLLYKLTNEKRETYSERDDFKTIDSFEKGNYRINENKRAIIFGKMEVLLK